VHADASSSPSADPSVVSIGKRGAREGDLQVDLSDGSSFFVHPEAAARASFHEGKTISAAAIADLVAESEAIRAKERGLALIARCAHSRFGLERKLRLKGFSRTAVDSAISRITELGYLDDRAFAEAWVRSRLASRREGWKALYHGLLRHGIGREMAEEAIDGQYPEEEELERARALAAALPPRKAASRLAARGFRTRVIAKVIREAGRTAGTGETE
jgi:regulatory protein